MSALKWGLGLAGVGLALFAIDRYFKNRATASSPDPLLHPALAPAASRHFPFSSPDGVTQSACGQAYYALNAGDRGKVDAVFAQADGALSPDAKAAIFDAAAAGWGTTPIGDCLRQAAANQRPELRPLQTQPLGITASNVDWYVYSAVTEYYILTAAGNAGVQTALTTARGNLAGTDASAEAWGFSASAPSGVTYQDLIAKSKAAGAFVFMSQAYLDALKSGGLFAVAYVYVVQPANVDTFLRTMRATGTEPVYVSTTYL